MFFNSNKEINRLTKEINRLLSEGISIIYLEFTIKTLSKLGLSGFKKIGHQVNFWEVPTHADIIEFENFLLQLKKKRSGSKTVYTFSIILILKGIITF